MKLSQETSVAGNVTSQEFTQNQLLYFAAQKAPNHQMCPTKLNVCVDDTSAKILKTIGLTN